MPTNSSANAQTAIDWLKRHGSKSGRDGMRRYNIPSDRAFGVPMRQVQELSKQLGHDHGLAADLWATGWYEARLLAAYVDVPASVSVAQMDCWCRDFDNWAVCDTVCFVTLRLDGACLGQGQGRAPRRAEDVKRAAFALLWGLTVHDKTSGDAPFLRALTLIERAASDERHFVKKGVDCASCRWQAQCRPEHRCQQCCPPPDGLFR